MKKLFSISIISLFFISSVFAQNWFAGGSAAIQYNTNQGVDNSITFDFFPTIGYKINSKLDLGLNPIYIYEKNSSSYVLDTNIFGVGIFTRYNLLEIERFSILAQFGINYLYGRYNIVTRETITYSPIYSVERETGIININSIGVNISPVFQYRISDRLILYTSIGRLYYSHTWSNKDTKSNNMGLSFSTGLLLGFNVLF